MSEKKVSAIVATYNRCDLLPKAIESLIDQTIDKSEYEIIVVDNASTDQTRQICEGYRDRANFRYVYEKEAGVSIAYERGLFEAKGRYVAFLDDDAIASHEWLERIVNTFETVVPAPASVGGRIVLIWEIPKPDWFPDDKKSFLGFLDYGQTPIFLKYPRVLFGSNMAFRRDVLLGIQGFRTDIGRGKKNLRSNADVFIFSKLHEKNLLALYHPDITVSHLALKERLTKKWLYRRLYWQGRSDILMRSGLPRGSILKDIGLSLQEFSQKLITLYRMRNKSISAASEVSHISSIYNEVGRIHQLFLELRKRPLMKDSKAEHIPKEKYTFEEMKQGWQVSGEVEISCDNEATFRGNRGLRVAGTGKSGDWSFARSEPYSIFPGKHYEVSGWMLIETISENTSFLKCDLQRGGRWLKSIRSNEYDLSRKGQWQALTAEFISPKGEDVTVSFAIGKRPMEKDVKAVIYLNAIRLEMGE